MRHKKPHSSDQSVKWYDWVLYCNRLSMKRAILNTIKNSKGVSKNFNNNRLAPDGWDIPK